MKSKTSTESAKMHDYCLDDDDDEYFDVLDPYEEARQLVRDHLMRRARLNESDAATKKLAVLTGKSAAETDGTGYGDVAESVPLTEPTESMLSATPNPAMIEIELYATAAVSRRVDAVTCTEEVLRLKLKLANERVAIANERAKIAIER